jgi:nitroreductase
MMETMEAILSRRSIRKYTKQPIPEEKINELLRAAMSAPSAGNEQPWQFIVIRERQTLDAIPKHHPYSQMLTAAPMAILICGDKTLERHRDFWIQDCSAATENLLLAAHANGLGAVWLGVYPRDDRIKGIRDLLRIPENIVPFALISIGYPAEQKAPVNRYDVTRIHWDRW